MLGSEDLTDKLLSASNIIRLSNACGDILTWIWDSIIEYKDYKAES